GLRGQALAEHHLENVTGPDVFLALLDRFFEVPRCEVGRVLPVHFADGGDVGQLEVGNALLEPLDQPVHALAGRPVTAGRVARIDVGVGHRGDGLVDVVENHHAVVEGETQVRQLAVVGRRVGQPFHVADRVKAGVTDRPTGKARQAGDVGSPVGRQL